ncbi:MAG: ABC transporter permease subunit/CPBP intramembrane protease [Planctomycetota bacterium]
MNESASSHSSPLTSFTEVSLSRLSRLARKELRESLRDRRTLATLILMPLIVYPLLGSVVQKFAVARFDPQAPAAVVIVDPNLPPQFFPTLLQDQPGATPPGMSKPQQSPDGTDTAKSLENLSKQILAGQNPLNAGEPAVRIDPRLMPDDASWESLIQDAQADVGVRMIPETTDPKSGQYQFGAIEVLCREADPFSSRAAAEVERRLRDVRDEITRQNLLLSGGDTSVMPRMARITLSANGPKESPLSAFVPLMLVLMTMTGAVYPAIDLTAGERERGTLEMLVAAPVSRRALLTAKFIAVFTVAVLTAMINLVAMLLTIYGTGFDKAILGDSASVGTFLQVLSLLVVFASFFSAVLLGITSFARSFREAQAWLIPLMLISLAPGILSLMPGVRLTPGLAVIPLINIVLLGKELFQGIASPLLFALTLFVTMGYTLLALRTAARVFGSDTVLFGSSVAIRKTNKDDADRVPRRIAVLSLIMLAPAFVVLAGLRGKVVALDNLRGQLVLSAVITIALFAVLPAFLTMWQRVRMPSSFALRGASPLSLIGAILLGVTMWTAAYEMLLMMKGTSGWSDILSNPRLQELARRLTDDTPLLLRLITLALIPAVCEELFFRGFLMNALLTNPDRWKAPWLLTSFLFAVFHVVVDQSLTLERFPATFMLGLILGWIRIRTRSIFPGILLHLLNNGLLLSLTELEPLFEGWGMSLSLENESHLPGRLFASCLILAAAGFIFIWFGSRTAEPPQIMSVHK